MKKINTFLTVLFLFGVLDAAYGQKLYTSLSVGYGFKSGASNIEGFSNRYQTASTDTEEQLKISLGQGFNAEGIVGYSFNDNMSGELGISYLLGASHSATDNDQTQPRTRTYDLKSKMLRLSPTMVFSSKVGSVSPYFKLGVVVGFGKINYDFNENDAGTIEKQEWEFKEGTSFGLKAGAGIEFPLSDKMSFFSELMIINQSYAPERGEMKVFTINGVDELPGQPVKDRTINFVDNIDYNKNIPDSQPDEALRQYFPFGSINLQAGIKFTF